MSKHITAYASEIAILQKNLKDLQGQLANAHKRILELIRDKDSAKEELVKERQLLLELEKEFSDKEAETCDLIEKQIEDWPEVLDSKPEKTFKAPKVPSYLVKEGEKWTRIKEDGTIEFIDIQPGEWD
jgi:predicted  nucleic acid-binding Zn-ribbon protein